MGCVSFRPIFPCYLFLVLAQGLARLSVGNHVTWTMSTDSMRCYLRCRRHCATHTCGTPYDALTTLWAFTEKTSANSWCTLIGAARIVLSRLPDHATCRRASCATQLNVLNTHTASKVQAQHSRRTCAAPTSEYHFTQWSVMPCQPKDRRRTDPVRDICLLSIASHHVV